MIFDLDNNQIITCRWLKANGYHRIVWGAPDYYTDSGSKNRWDYIRAPRARWRCNSFAWEKVTDEMSIIYFPPQFNKYVNVENLDHYPNRAMIATSNNTFHSDTVVLANVRRVQDVLTMEAMAQEKLGVRESDYIIHSPYVL